MQPCQRNTTPRRTEATAACAATVTSYATAGGGNNVPVGFVAAAEAALENPTGSRSGERRSKSSSRRRSRNAAHLPTEESGSSEVRVNVSETSSSDWFSEAFSSGNANTCKANVLFNSPTFPLLNEPSPPPGAFSDKHMEILRIRLTRPYPSCPWGIIISGTDDVNDAPVVIDSLTPGKPGAISGLLRPGDQILAVNDVSATRGLTLSQVMARLQLPSEQVLFYIARPVGEAARHLNTSRACSTRGDSTPQLLSVKQQSSSAVSRQTF
ncbi:unnamed protein product [Dibothriocephalus latus]|uniref:PDZ domain-containing protein n=1 Tax=Dibothriocephalus latus TaxID=60516 RepID=A0A3P7M1H8_DIBLA|nr:unnamed protein product [Dibothriocephalus latus]